MSNNDPSNIRINPFVGSGGATTYVNLTETHIIPSVSPFVIRLNEVPEKRDPSNMKCVYVDDTTGAVTSRALTEVAATPAAGQFRPDYSTKADKDDSWNTGLVEFNSADAGKIVQITYTGMGTLAAVQSNKYPSWYTDRGDGSDGDFIPSENTTIDGVKNYKRVFIKAGITVTVDKYVIIKCQDSFVNLGTITADGQGALGGAGGGQNLDGENGGQGFITSGAGGGSDRAPKGGKGAIGDLFGYVINKKVIKMWFKNNPLFFCGSGGGGGSGHVFIGSKGGDGGSGGGCIIIVSKSIINNGTISANGNDGKNGNSDNGGSGGGGGGGGGCIIITDYYVGIKNITANKGIGGKASYRGNAGADGDDGIVYIKQLGAL